MNDYERGFKIGEQHAFAERHNGEQKSPPKVVLNARERGYWDGYMPRNPSWAVVHRQPWKLA